MTNEINLQFKKFYLKDKYNLLKLINYSRKQREDISDN